MAIAAALVFLGVALMFTRVHPTAVSYQPSDYARGAYGTATTQGSFVPGFMTLNYLLLTGLGIHDFGVQPRLAPATEGEWLRFSFQHENHVHASELKSLLASHLSGFREAHGKKGT